MSYNDNLLIEQLNLNIIPFFSFRAYLSTQEILNCIIAYLFIKTLMQIDLNYIFRFPFRFTFLLLFIHSMQRGSCSKLI